MTPPPAHDGWERRASARRLFRLETDPGSRRDGDLDEEIRFHLEARAEQLIDEGYAPEHAWTEAVARFAGHGRSLTQSRDSLRRTAGIQERHMRLRDLAGATRLALYHAARALARRPGFAVIVIATLALGIGATAAMFAVVDGVLLRPLPFGHPEQLASVSHDVGAVHASDIGQSAATYRTYRQFARSLAGIGLYQVSAVNVADERGTERPQRLVSADITANLIPLLQLAPLVGRTFTEAEDVPHGPAVVMISEGLWRSRFGADAHILGRTLHVDGVSREIVGVMPSAFRFPSADTQLWLPLGLDRADDSPSSFSFKAVARLRAGVSIADAQRELVAVLPRMPELVPNAAPGLSMQAMLDQAQLAPVVAPLRDAIVGRVAGTLWIVAAAALLVLLVACANVANLVLVRADGRQRELAVRAALGAGRLRVLTPLLAEAAVLAIVAGVLGLAVAAFGVRALAYGNAVELPRLAEVHVDGRVVAFTVIVTTLVALACGAIPALRTKAEDLTSALREGGRGGTVGRARQRVRATLVAAQIALALVILATSGLLLRSFRALYAVRPGWTADHVQTLWLALPDAGYPSDSDVVRFYARLTSAVAALPGVRAVGLTSRVPLVARGQSFSPIWVEGDAASNTALPPTQLMGETDGGFFEAMRIPVIAGRTFRSIDGAQRNDEAIVNRATAEYFWHDPTGRRAVGKRFRELPSGPWITVVGVVESVRDTSLEAPPALTVYLPQVAPPSSRAMTSDVSRTMALVVRASGDPGAVVKPVERIVASLDPTLPVFDARPMRDVVRASTARLSFTMIVLGAAASITLFLGAIGLYGVIAYVVAMRTRELGVRIALGATPRAIRRMVTRQGLVLAAAGIGAGLVLFALVSRFLRVLLFGVTPADPLTLVMVAVMLLGVAALASWAPARRASRVDPMEALRSE